MPIEHSPAPATAAPASAIRPLHILYADDMPELRVLLQDALALEGHSIETAGDGNQALERLKQAQSGFDLVITDHHMPGISGLELVRQARELPYPGKIVVFSSGLSEPVQEEYRRFSVDAILTKPVFPAMLDSMLVQLFGIAPVTPPVASESTKRE